MLIALTSYRPNFIGVKVNNEYGVLYTNFML